MPLELPAYLAQGNQLAQRDLQNIQQLLNPITDYSEINRRAAEQSLYGGGFSGARQNRLQRSEQIAQYGMANQLLAPYLQRAEQARLQEQQNALQLQRDIQQREHELLLETKRAENATGIERLRAEENMRRLQAEIAANKERQQLDLQSQATMQAVEQGGLNSRQAQQIASQERLSQNSIQAELNRLLSQQNFQANQSSLDRQFQAGQNQSDRNLQQWMKDPQGTTRGPSSGGGTYYSQSAGMASPPNMGQNSANSNSFWLDKTFDYLQRPQSTINMNPVGWTRI